MSEVITGALKLTFGFLAKKIRSEIAERLKDGDVTDEECRRLIVRELDDIKSKLDGLARKDLLSSLCFLQEGINGVDQSLFRLDSNGVTAKSTEQVTSVEAAASSRDTGTDTVMVDAAALINAITSLKIRSNDRLKSAIKSFELAREKATEAFCNEALSIEDRIQATQIRMMARILEKLEDPDASVSDCLQYLKQLHDVGAIQETFSVLIHGGIKSRFNKTKRLDNASSVQLMNQILFEFARKFTKLRLRHLMSWPVIWFGNENYRPVFGEYRATEKLEKSGVENICVNMLSTDPDFEFDDRIFPWLSVVNSKVEILAVTRPQRGLKVFKRSGEGRALCEVPREEDALLWDVAAMNNDADDNIYLITSFQNSDEKSWSFKLFIFDENGNKKLECPLPFQQSSYLRVSIAINKDGKIAILDYEKKTLHIGKACFEQNSFGVEKSLTINQLEVLYVVVFPDFTRTKIFGEDDFYIYTDNGHFKSEINKIDKEDEFVNSFAINHAIERILVKKIDSSLGRCSVVSFSETGEQIDSFYLGSSKWIRKAELTSYPNGPVALVGERKAALLQLQ